jgi:hypothetical protein
MSPTPFGQVVSGETLIVDHEPDMQLALGNCLRFPNFGEHRGMNMANKLKFIGRCSSLGFVLSPAPFHGIRIVKSGSSLKLREVLFPSRSSQSDRYAVSTVGEGFGLMQRT